jgi:hypothetical protein
MWRGKSRRARWLRLADSDQPAERWMGKGAMQQLAKV